MQQVFDITWNSFCKAIMQGGKQNSVKITEEGPVSVRVLLVILVDQNGRCFLTFSYSQDEYRHKALDQGASQPSHSSGNGTLPHNAFGMFRYFRNVPQNRREAFLQQ
ncbi:UNVERIFIED_CONTAM: hypothetical protein K2H54_006103 [Gekko kuhli]